ncbi:AMP-binding protein [Aliiglaciecola sp. SL4]|uniref:AMP-binding protein n=1 Tax=Aliiglaciecola sp. SL4 TaxID=3239806 RepID=UPI00355B22D3
MSKQQISPLSTEELEEYWATIAEKIEWFKPYKQVIDKSIVPIPQWFVGGQMNTCHNALDRHVNAGRGKNIALIYDSDMTGERQQYSYQMLLEATTTFAGAMARQGIGKGDRVIIYMPMIPQAIIAMLACARVGAIHSVIYGGTAVEELASRMEDTKAKLVITASCGLKSGQIVEYKPIIDEAIDQTIHQPDLCVVLQRQHVNSPLKFGRDHNWFDFIADAVPQDCVHVEATDPLYIIYASGVMGKQKGLIRDNGGHAVELNWTMTSIYNLELNDVFWASSDISCIVGHSYLVYGPLFNGATTILYEGKQGNSLDAGAFLRIIDEYKVTYLLTDIKALETIKAENLVAEKLQTHNFSSLKSIYLTGDKCKENTLLWYKNTLNIPIIDHWWQTETIWPIAAVNNLDCGNFKPNPTAVSRAIPGWNVQVLDSNGIPTNGGETGEIVCRLPLPPASLVNQWNAETYFIESHFSVYPGFYKTGDTGYVDDNGQIIIVTRFCNIVI